MRRLLTTLTLCILIIVNWLGAVTPPVWGEQPPQEDPWVTQLMERMSVEEKVGQLFLVAFPGTDVGPDSDIAELITEYRIGGVVLLEPYGNVSNQGDTPRQVLELSNALQALSLSVPPRVITMPITTTATLTVTPLASTPTTLTPAPPPSPTITAGIASTGTPTGVVTATITPTATLTPTATPTPTPTPIPTVVITEPVNHIPLFIAVNHEGDGYPYTLLENGFTALPNNMALGATWHPENALVTGRIVGQELAAVGVNMLLGPSLDVLDRPRPGLRGDMGTRCFGGDPYWVSVMGKAYIQGVHEGSGGRLLVVAKHFPGHGGSNRDADEEVSTVDKSLQELKRIELPPFAAATDISAGRTPATADGLMTAHIRYRGFQGGNIRQFTRPISLDTKNLQALLAEPELAPWREAGGVLVSGPLGVPAVRRFYDPQERTFNPKRIAQEAFLAGNDLLFLSHFALTDDWAEQMANIKEAILYFQEKYATDPSFQTRVDEAVARILTLKHRLYSQFSLKAVQVDPAELEAKVGQGREDVLQIAKEAVTLIYPDPEGLADRLPSPPLADESIVIFTDDRQTPDGRYFIDPRALQDKLLELYGPQASGQVDPQRLSSRTFSQLKAFLERRDPVLAGEIETQLKDADWIIFAMLDYNPRRYPQSDAVQMMLERRPDLLRGKKVVALAFNAPYYLDSTEISKLTAYYGIYSKTEPFIEAAVRALFQEFTPTGAPPVSVEGINYDLLTQMSPDPTQVIQLFLPEQQAGEGTPVPLVLEVGDTLRIRTGVILDHNGHPVPDNTPVTFRLRYPAEAVELAPYQTFTVNGIAEAEIVVERMGELVITASSDPAYTSVEVKVTIQGEDQPVMVETVVPTPTPTHTPTFTPTPTPTFTPPPPTPTSTPSPTPTPALPPLPPSSPSVPRRLDARSLLLSLLSIAGMSGLGYLVAYQSGRSLAQRLRLCLWCVVGGLTGYNLYGMGALGGDWLYRWLGRWTPVLVVVAFSALPLLVALRGRGRAQRMAGEEPIELSGKWIEGK